ncbi:hypothetical protein J6590_022731 [Homalodisca vitripennis]|nr:hypothetical protein J6590_022731 [Homalodisca vitripennis]
MLSRRYSSPSRFNEWMQTHGLCLAISKHWGLIILSHSFRSSSDGDRWCLSHLLSYGGETCDLPPQDRGESDHILDR